MAKLVAIGDSLSQGFQSGAVFYTDLSFPALMARSMGLEVPTQFRVPRFPGSGLPINIEYLLRWMQTRLGPDIEVWEWTQFPFLLGEFMDGVEDLYERGAGAQPAAFGGVYHNLSVWGFRVIDCLKVSSDYCQKVIKDEEGLIEDDYLGLPSASMYRTAQRVLNPKRRPERKSWTQLDNLQQIVKEDGKLDYLILYLGSNDCLGTVTNLEIRDMKRTNVSDDPQRRREWNLTHPEVFKKDYTELVTRIKTIIPAETKVFVATIGHVTIPPITQGIPPFRDGYFEYYGYFYSNPGNFNRWLHKHLTRQQAQEIDHRIDEFNEIIKTLVQHQGPNWHLVDICAVLDTLAVKRNGMESTPDRPLREYYAQRGLTDHPLLHLSPVPNVLRLTTDDSQRLAGGFFSLDCIHPTTIGYGLVAEEFLRIMRQAGVTEADPARLNWQGIIAVDTLLQQPPLLWDDIITAAERYPTFWNMIFKVL